jgi:YidC/Oxa1 family membrane protein insertase
MDRNQVTGLLLLMGMLLGYQFFFAPKDEPKQAQKRKLLKLLTKSAATTTVDTVALKAAAGDFATAATGVAQEVVLENKDIKVTFSTKGGKVKQVLLKHYKTYNDFAAHKETL